MTIVSLSLESQLDLIGAETANVSLEASAAAKGRMPKFLASITDSITGFLKGAEEGSLEHLVGKSFATTLRDTPYTALSEITLDKPLGLKVTYLEYQEVLEEWSEALNDIESRLLGPIAKWLAVNISNSATQLKLQDVRGFHFSKTDKLIKSLEKVLEPSSDNSVGYYSELVKRNKDWDEVCRNTNDLVNGYYGTSNKQVLASVNNIIESADILIKQLQENDNRASNATVKAVADTLYMLAKEVELYGILGYNLKVLNEVMKQDLEKLKSVVEK